MTELEKELMTENVKLKSNLQKWSNLKVSPERMQCIIDTLQKIFDARKKISNFHQVCRSPEKLFLGRGFKYC